MAQTLVIGIAASLGTFALTAVFVRWGNIGLRDVGALPSVKSPLRFAGGCGIGILLVCLHAGIERFVGHTHWIRGPTISLGGVGLMLLGYFALSCREELAFHGYPLRVLARLTGLWGAQAIVAGAFIAEHVAGGWSWERALAGAGVGSLLFGMASLATRGLAMPIGIHAAWNFGDWMRGSKETPGVWTPLVDPGFEGNARLVAQLSYIVVMLGATAVFWWWYRRHGEET